MSEDESVEMEGSTQGKTYYIRCGRPGTGRIVQHMMLSTVSVICIRDCQSITESSQRGEGLGRKSPCVVPKLRLKG